MRALWFQMQTSTESRQVVLEQEVGLCLVLVLRAAVLECIGLQPSCITQATVPQTSACVKMYCVVDHPSELMIEQQSCICLLLLSQCTMMSREAAYLLLPQIQCHKLLQTYCLTGKGMLVTLRYRVEGVCVSR